MQFPAFTNIIPCMNDTQTKPEQVKVKRVENSNQPEKPKTPLGKKMYYAFFPIIGGLMLDCFDLMTFSTLLGPPGVFIGLVVGFIIGYMICSVYQFNMKAKLIWSLLAALYCAAPLTEFVPVATIISAVSRFNHPPKK